MRASRRRTGAGVALAAAAALMLVTAGPAGARDVKALSGAFYAGPVGPDYSAVVGVMASTDKKCIAGRVIKVTLVTGSGDVKLDTARSGRNGGWMARGTNDEFTGVVAGKILIPAKKVGKGKSAVKCAKVKEDLT